MSIDHPPEPPTPPDLPPPPDQPDEPVVNEASIENDDILRHPDLDRDLVRQALEHYNPEDLSEFIGFYDDVIPEYVNGVISVLNEVHDVEGIEQLLPDLASFSGTTARGAEGLLRYISEHKGEIAAVEIPDVVESSRGLVYERRGIDVLNRDESVVEIKNYDFGSPRYAREPEEIAGRAVAQAERRLASGSPSVKLVFLSPDRDPPAAFTSALTARIGDNPNITWGLEKV